MEHRPAIHLVFDDSFADPLADPLPEGPGYDLIQKAQATTQRRAQLFWHLLKYGLPAKIATWFATESNPVR